jgi:hypothetical protein
LTRTAAAKGKTGKRERKVIFVNSHINFSPSSLALQNLKGARKEISGEKRKAEIKGRNKKKNKYKDTKMRKR